MCVAVMLCCFMQTALADWYDDIKPNGTWIPIKGDNFVADTFMGVPAYYNEDDYYYQCGELIIRFYKEAYGLDVYPYTAGGPTVETEGYELVKTKSPQKGDIIYVSKEMRGSSQDHWAIVKDYRDGYIVMFEQNAVHNGGAAFERKIKFPSDSYYIFTPVSLGEAPDPVLKNASTGKEEKPETTQTTTKPTTTVPTTAEPTTLKPTVPSTKPVTTKAQTTKPATTVPKTKPATTVPSTKPTTVVALTKPEKTTAQATTVEATMQAITEESTTAIAITELNTTQVMSDKTENAVTEQTTARAQEAEKKNGDTQRIMLAVGACVSLIIVSALIMVVAKNKRK